MAEISSFTKAVHFIMDPSLVHGYSFHGSEKTTREKEVIQFDFINSHVSKLKAVMAIISLSFFAFVVHNFYFSVFWDSLADFGDGPSW